VCASPVSDAFRILFDGRFRVVIGGNQLTLTGHGVNPSMTVSPPALPSSP